LFSISFLDATKRSFDTDHPCIKVDGIPPQSQDLPSPKSSMQCDQDPEKGYGSYLFLFPIAKELVHLLMLPERKILFWEHKFSDPGYGILIHKAPMNTVIIDFSQEPQDIVARFWS